MEITGRLLKSFVVGCVLMSTLILGCQSNDSKNHAENPQSTDNLIEVDSVSISRTVYHDRLQGFWLGQCIANWTGLVTEMDKVGNIGEFKTGDFYSREDWGTKDQPSIWGEGIPSDLSATIDFVLRDTN